MISVYAEVGASLQQIGGDIPDGWIVMQGERPTPEHVANELGEWVLPVPKAEDFIAAIQSHMDSTAKSYGYDDIKSAVTYAEEPSVLKFQIEGRAFRAWRSQVWDYGYNQLALVEGGEREQPTIEAILAELPVFEVIYE